MDYMDADLQFHHGDEPYGYGAISRGWSSMLLPSEKQWDEFGDYCERQLHQYADGGKR